MYEYMRSLQKQFTLPLEREELERKIETLENELRIQLNKPQRRVLTELINLEDELRDNAALNSFFSGYRLAAGIYKELSSRPPLSFDAEEERLAREHTEQLQNKR